MMSPEQIVDNLTTGYFDAYMVGLNRRRQLEDVARMRSERMADEERLRRERLADIASQREWTSQERQAAWEHDKTVAEEAVARQNKQDVVRNNRALSELSGYTSNGKPFEEWDATDREEANKQLTKKLAKYISDQEEAEWEVQKAINADPDPKKIITAVMADPTFIASGTIKDTARRQRFQLAASNGDVTDLFNAVSKDEPAKAALTEALTRISKEIGSKQTAEAMVKYHRQISRYNGQNIAFQDLAKRVTAVSPSALMDAYASLGKATPDAVKVDSELAFLTNLTGGGDKTKPPPPAPAAGASTVQLPRLTETGIIPQAYNQVAGPLEKGLGYVEKVAPYTPPGMLLKLGEYGKNLVNDIRDYPSPVDWAKARLWTGAEPPPTIFQTRPYPGTPQPQLSNDIPTMPVFGYSPNPVATPAPTPRFIVQEPTPAPANTNTMNMMRVSTQMRNAYGSDDPNEMQALREWFIQTSGLPRDVAAQQADAEAQSAAQGNVASQERIKNLLIQFRQRQPRF